MLIGFDSVNLTINTIISDSKCKIELFIIIIIFIFYEDVSNWTQFEVAVYISFIFSFLDLKLLSFN